MKNNWNFKYDDYYSDIAKSLILWGSRIKNFDKIKTIKLFRKADKYEDLHRKNTFVLNETKAKSLNLIKLNGNNKLFNKKEYYFGQEE